MIRAIRWQTLGNEETLDSRLVSSRGVSKIHALHKPRESSRFWSVYADIPMLCGVRSPEDDWLLRVEELADALSVTCKKCRKTINRQAEAAKR